jgi:DnaA-homolog protein
MKQLALDIGLQPPATLAGFHAGPNAAALQHLQLWVDAGTARSPVPTLLWGDVGVGKTHLLLAVREAAREQGASVGLLTADDDPFAAPSFDTHWAAVLLDDVHRFSAEHQRVAFSWFVNAVNPTQGQAAAVFATSAVPPVDLPVREDLRTRLGWGHVFELQRLSDADRRAVLRAQADARGIFLRDDVMDYILSRFSRDLGHLSGLIDQLDAHSLQMQRPLTIALVRDLLNHMP